MWTQLSISLLGPSSALFLLHFRFLPRVLLPLGPFNVLANIYFDDRTLFELFPNSVPLKSSAVVSSDFAISNISCYLTFHHPVRSIARS